MRSLTFSRQLSIKWTILILLLGMLSSAAIGSFGYAGLSLLSTVNHLFYDGYLKRSATEQSAAGVVVVDIDEVSLDQLGQWPWPRYRVAMLVQSIAEMRPAAIGLDIIFSEEDRTALVNIQKAYEKDFGLKVGFTGVPPELTDNDGYFGFILSKTGAVGAKYFYFDYISGVELQRDPPFQIGGRTNLLKLYNAPGMLDNTFKIASQLRYEGFLNNQPDEDGMLRRLPLLIEHKGVVYPHLALATLMRSMGLSSASIDEGPFGPYIQVGQHRIPITDRGFALVRYSGSASKYPSMSALDILSGAVGQNALQGKIVFVGSSAAGLKDLYHTVFDAQFPGVKTHAAMVENMLNNRTIIEPVWSGAAVLVASVLTGAVISLLFVFSYAVALVLAGTLLWILLLMSASFVAFEQIGLFLSPGTPIVIALLLFMLFSIARYAIEKRHAYIWFRQLANARQVTMESMAAVAESRDPETGAHIKRTQHYVRAIGEKLMQMGHYSDVLTPAYIDLLFVSAPLHDIGKVGVPDNILMKPGKLTDEEFELMKMHTDYGKKIIYSTAKKIEGDNFLVLAGEIASTHHEKWDGSGYPYGLAGDAIPLSGRIMAVADVYDALISRRCYKPPFPHEKACELLHEGRGRDFDPLVLDMFFAVEEQIKEIAARFVDENEMVLGDR